MKEVSFKLDVVERISTNFCEVVLERRPTMRGIVVGSIAFELLELFIELHCNPGIRLPSYATCITAGSRPSSVTTVKQ